MSHFVDMSHIVDMPHIVDMSHIVDILHWEGEIGKTVKRLAMQIAPKLLVNCETNDGIINSYLRFFRFTCSNT